MSIDLFVNDRNHFFISYKYKFANTYSLTRFAIHVWFSYDEIHGREIYLDASFAPENAPV